MIKLFIEEPDEVPDETMFAFYDTIYDRFMEFDGSSAWYSKTGFTVDFQSDKENSEGEDIERYLRLIPEPPTESELETQTH